MPQLLEGLRVVEMAGLVAGPYTTKILGDLGADVVKVEPLEGDPARRVGPFVDGAPEGEGSVLFLHLNTSKRGVRLDLATPEGSAAASDLVAGADLVVTDRDLDELAAAGLGLDDPSARPPGLVVLSLSPFGREGLYRDYRATPFTTFHGAGEGYLTPVASYLMPEVVERPPLRQGRFASEYKLATYAGTLALAAVAHARATGRGQLIELSKQDALLGLNFFEFQGYLALGIAPSRASLAVPFGGIMPCKDGYLQFTFHEEHQWRALVALMGDPAWAKESWAASDELRLAHKDEINALLEEWLATRTRDEVVRLGQQIGCTVAPYHTIPEVAASEQLDERSFFQPVDHPAVGRRRYPTGPWRFSGFPPAPGPAPLLGQHDGEAGASGGRWAGERVVPVAGRGDGRGPGALSGVRVLDFTWAVAGPTATMVLASLGAEVIKVESALRPDVLRRTPFIGVTTSRQKKAVTLNLRHPSAVELAKRLVSLSDVVAESFRPGVMDGLGLGYEVLASIRPDLVMLSSSMAGQSGPYAKFAGYAPMFVALSGLGDMTGYEDGPPTQIRVGGDIIVGVHGGFAVVAALVAHQATGRGTHIDLSAIESQACLIGDSILDYTLRGHVQTRTGNDEPDIAPHNCYRCRGDDQWVSIAVETDDDWRRFVAAVGAPSWAGPDLRTAAERWARRRELDRLVESWTIERTPGEVTAVLQAAGVAAMPSYRATELFADPHVVSRDMVATVPDAEGKEWRLLRLGGRLEDTPFVLDRAGPDLGEHNEEIFGGLLGLSSAEMASLADDGVFT